MQTEKQKVEIPMTTLPFYMYEKEGIVYYEFDARECEPPEPMLNTLHALNHLKNKNERLKGVYFHEPSPMLQKVSQNFNYEVKTLQNGDVEVLFGLK